MSRTVPPTRYTASIVRDRGHGVEHGPQPFERVQLQIVSHVRAQPASAIASISTFAPDGSAETSIVARAGGVAPTWRA